MNSDTKIPTPSSPFRRSASVRVRGERPFYSASCPRPTFPAIGEKDEMVSAIPRKPLLQSRVKLLRSMSQSSGLNKDDDMDSVKSFGSNISMMSNMSSCEHASFARNGTTFSGRNMKYIVHCSHSTPTEEYLTPTQRANKKIKQLKSLLQLAKEKLLEKEREIFKLTKEVVELRLFKASLKTSPNLSDVNSPVDETKDIEKSMVNLELNSTAVDKDFVCDTFNDLSPIKTSCFETNESMEKLSFTPDYLLSSLADSGHYEDLASSLSLQSKDSLNCCDKSRPSSSEPRFKKDDIKLYYENKLDERRVEYQRELTNILKEKEDESLEMLNNFEQQLKIEQNKYEEKLKMLLKMTEDEKVELVNEFEKKLDEAKAMYMKVVNEQQSQTDFNYKDTVDGQRDKYNEATKELNLKFEAEKLRLEAMYDESMNSERTKFEQVVKEIQSRSNDKVEELLNKIAVLEKRYAEMEPNYEAAKIRIIELESENDRINKILIEQEERQKSMFLKMFMKGQQAARLEQEEQVAKTASSAPEKVSVPELLVQLQITEAELDNLKAMYKRLADTQSKIKKTKEKCDCDPEATLQFLKSAVYYFLTDSDNHLEHLRAIESILGFSPAERANIEKACLV